MSTVPPATHLLRKVSPWDTSSSVSVQHYIETGRFLTYLETVEAQRGAYGIDSNEHLDALAASNGAEYEHAVTYCECTDEDNLDDDEIRVTVVDCDGSISNATLTWDGDGWAAKCRVCGVFTDAAEAR